MLRGFSQRKLRALLTGIAIALGVALMAGTYILTDTINHVVRAIFRQRQRERRRSSSPPISRSVRSTSVQNGGDLPLPMLAQRRAVPGVAAAAGRASRPASLFDAPASA